MMSDHKKIPLLLEKDEYRNDVSRLSQSKNFSDRRKRMILAVGVVVLCSLFVLASQTDFLVFDNHLYRTQRIFKRNRSHTSIDPGESSLPDSGANSMKHFSAGGFSTNTNISDVCVHPKIDKFDPEIMRYYSILPPVCRGQRENITSFANRKLLNNNPEKYDCWGRCLVYKSNKENNEGSWHSIDEDFSYGCDIIQASCSLKGEAFNQSYYHHLHTQLVEIQPSPPKYPAPPKQYSVYFIVVDSHSYTQHFRNLPKTNEFLEKEMEAIIFPYMNRVADRSRENAISWWFGKLTETIDRSRYGLPPFLVEPRWAKAFNCKRQLDNETMLIKEFAEYGYVTNLSEDWFGSIDYECAGFKNLVSDHTYMPYVLEYEKNRRLREWLEKKQCLHRHQHLLDYDFQFLQAYKGKPKMMWTWIIHIGHNNVYLSKELDPHLLDLFKKNKKELENSFVFLAGDHGLRNSDAVKTRVGKLDINNPLLVMMLPKELRAKKGLVEMIKENAGELQTHFDTRATLLDILKYQPVADFETRDQLDIPGELGHSFMRRQPRPRNCKTLPIPTQHCICEGPLNVNLTGTDTNRTNLIGQRLVASINKKLESNGLQHKCREWQYTGAEALTLVSEAPVSVSGIILARTDDKTTEPSQFRIFGTGQSDVEMETVSLDRLDRYGNSGDCVQRDLRPICTCL